jgi:hypothetical protein
MSTVDNDRPPYVTWETRPVEDRNASLSAGHYVSKDVDFAVITRPGSRDSIDKEALVWLADLREKSRKGELPPRWYESFAESYKFWKAGEETPLVGTSIKDWPTISPAARKDLLAAGIRTVEDLAEFPESDLAVIGTGALAYKMKAQAWLKAANDTGKVAEQLAAMTVQISELTRLTREQAAELDSLRPKVKAKPTAETPL